MQLNLETAGFTYQKWGGTQSCCKGDWLVDNQGDFYTVKEEVFSKTYRQVSPGIYRKVVPICAEIARVNGSIITKEGITHYSAGDYIEYNENDPSDTYAIERSSFLDMYEPLE